MAGAVGAEGGDDVGVGEALVEGGEVGVGAVKGDDAAGVGDGGVGVQDGPAFGLEGGDEPGVKESVLSFDTKLLFGVWPSPPCPSRGQANSSRSQPRRFSAGLLSIVRAGPGNR